MAQLVITEKGKLALAIELTTGVASQGRTQQEALEMLEDALELYREDDAEREDLQHLQKAPCTFP